MNGFVGGKVSTGPGVDVNDAVWGHHEVTGMTDAIGKDGCAESWRQLQTALIAGTCRAFSPCTWDGMACMSRRTNNTRTSHYRTNYRSSGECTERDGSGDKNSIQAERSHENLL